MVLCVNSPGKCTPIDFTAGSEMLLEQMFRSVAVPLKWMGKEGKIQRHNMGKS